MNVKCGVIRGWGIWGAQPGAQKAIEQHKIGKTIGGVAPKAGNAIIRGVAPKAGK